MVSMRRRRVASIRRSAIFQTAHEALEFRRFLHKLSPNGNEIIDLAARKAKGGWQREKIGLSIAGQTFKINVYGEEKRGVSPISTFWGSREPQGRT
jgi:hypothetical protein